MNVQPNEMFQVGALTGIVRAAVGSGAVIELALVSESGFTRTIVGDLFVLRVDEEPRRVQMLLAISPRYHNFPFLDELRREIFSLLSIPQTETWSLKVSPACVIDFESDPAEGYFELKS